MTSPSFTRLFTDELRQRQRQQEQQQEQEADRQQQQQQKPIVKDVHLSSRGIDGQT